MFDPGLKQGLKVLKFARIARLGPHLHVHHRIVSIVKGVLYHLGAIGRCGRHAERLKPVFGGGAGRHAGLVNPCSGLFNGVSVPVYGIGYQNRVVSHGRVAEAVPDTLKAFPHDLVLDLGVPPERKCWVGRSHQPGRLHKRDRQIVAGIRAVRLYAAHGPDPCPRNALEPFSGPSWGKSTHFITPDEEFSHQVQGVFFGQTLVNVHVLIIVRPMIVIRTGRPGPFIGLIPGKNLDKVI